MNREFYFEKLRKFLSLLTKIPDEGVGGQLKVQSVLLLSNQMMRVYQRLNEDPIQPLLSTLSEQITLLSHVQWPTSDGSQVAVLDDSKARVRHLYEQAWTSYDQRTYDHSVQLMIDRLRANNLDESFFRGKSCLDAGCGTGRFAIAMAKMGAQRVAAADIGVKSLAFGKERAHERDVANRIEFIELDITDLSRYSDSEFDFVASNGVLMCTGKTHQALREHFRVTKRGGLFWIYLYGEHGIMWDTYDLLRTAMMGVGPDRSRAHLLELETRLGMVYTFLDNVFAPVRTYHGTSEVLNVLSNVAPIEARPMLGLSDIDDSERQLKSKFGRLIFGDEAEVRQLVTRSG